MSSRAHEEYRSLENNPFARPPAVRLSGSAGSGTTVHVEFEGQAYDFDWPANTPLLDVLLAEGLDVSYVCRESACATCVCSVRSGQTHMRMNESLIDDELEMGLTLACQTLPESDHVHIAFDQ